MAPSVPTKELLDEFASEVSGAPATTLSQFQIFSLFLVCLRNSKCTQNKIHLICSY